MYQNEYSNSKNDLIVFAPLMEKGKMQDDVTGVYEIKDVVIEDSQEAWKGKEVHLMKRDHNEVGEKVGHILEVFQNIDGFIDAKGNKKPHDFEWYCVIQLDKKLPCPVVDLSVEYRITESGLKKEAGFPRIVEVSKIEPIKAVLLSEGLANFKICRDIKVNSEKKNNVVYSTVSGLTQNLHFEEKKNLDSYKEISLCDDVNQMSNENLDKNVKKTNSLEDGTVNNVQAEQHSLEDVYQLLVTICQHLDEVKQNGYFYRTGEQKIISCVPPAQKEEEKKNSDNEEEKKEEEKKEEEKKEEENTKRNSYQKGDTSCLVSNDRNAVLNTIF